jgi:hypothetical protein
MQLSIREFKSSLETENNPFISPAVLIALAVISWMYGLITYFSDERQLDYPVGRDSTWIF